MAVVGTIYAIKNPEGQLITWTCFHSQQAAWLAYMDAAVMTAYLEKRMRSLQDAGYSCVPVEIRETAEN